MDPAKHPEERAAQLVELVQAARVAEAERESWRYGAPAEVVQEQRKTAEALGTALSDLIDDEIRKQLVVAALRVASAHTEALDQLKSAISRRLPFGSSWSRDALANVDEVLAVDPPTLEMKLLSALIAGYRESATRAAEMKYGLMEPPDMTY